MEGYFETVVETLTGAGYRWYETANFCLEKGRAAGRDLRASLSTQLDERAQRAGSRQGARRL